MDDEYVVKNQVNFLISLILLRTFSFSSTISSKYLVSPMLMFKLTVSSVSIFLRKETNSLRIIIFFSSSYIFYSIFFILDGFIIYFFFSFLFFLLNIDFWNCDSRIVDVSDPFSNDMSVGSLSICVKKSSLFFSDSHFSFISASISLISDLPSSRKYFSSSKRS